ncbi:MAG: hydroxymethylbilane synthase [Myxococcales bacterium]|nr:hydroxymethylbilane synthase [Myxococcales bacterium]
MKYRIATRKSPLALWQAEHVAERIKEVEPAADVSLLEMTTRGDKILDQALSKVGGKDLFVKEIEYALLDKRAEVAVHSLKDVPTLLPESLVITAYPPREDPRDALISPNGYTLKTLPEGARVGTCSLRRAAQVLRLRPDIRIEEIRGNVQTRLQRMEERGMDATLLAYAGLTRLELTALASEVLSPEQCLPAIGQGILAVETRVDAVDVNAVISALDDPEARAAALAERSFLHRLEGGCQVPIAGHALLDGDRLWLRGMVASLDGKTVIEGDLHGPSVNAVSIGTKLAEQLLERGAGKILANLKQT